MKLLLTTFLLLVTMMVSYAEEFSLKEGIAVEIATKALDRFEYAHGNQYALQWRSKKDESFVFCKLDSNQTLVLVISSESRLIKELLVVADQKRRKEYPIITPDVVKISKSSFALFFTRNAEQDGADQPATALESKSEGDKKPKPESEGRSQ